MDARQSENAKPSEGEKLRLEYCWRMYNEHATQARHHETLRGTISTILVSLSSGIVAFYSFAHEHMSSTYDVYLGLTLIALGVLGGLLSYKHYERNRLHVSTLRRFRKEIDTILDPFGGSISKLNEQGRSDHERKYRWSSKWLRAYHLWMAMFLLVVMAGVLILAMPDG
jgi:hypothetical protein